VTWGIYKLEYTFDVNALIKWLSLIQLFLYWRAQYIDLYWWSHNSECCKLQLFLL